MANVEGAYCGVEDLRKGDIALPSYTSPEQYVKSAAEEIDAAIGHLYVTPLVVDPAPEFRPTTLFIKKINWLLASGRLVTDVAAAGEMSTLHAYGKRMLDEASAMLKLLTSSELVLAGVELIRDANSQNFPRGPMIQNEDAASLVEGFYVNHRPYVGLGESYPAILYPASVMPYGQ